MKISLAQSHPEFKSQWSTKNTKSIEEVSRGSGYAWWVCASGHEWEAPVYNRVKGSGCPYCSGFKPIIGETDLGTVNPILAAQLSPEDHLGPTGYTAMSGKKALWLCDRGHSWLSTVANRSNLGQGCPECNGRSTPLIEIKLLSSLSRYGEVLSHEKLGQLEVDILSPNHSVIVEYDGYWFHKDRIDKDIKKTTQLLELGYIVIRLREPGLDHLKIAHPNYREATFKWSRDQSVVNSEFDSLFKDLFQK